MLTNVTIYAQVWFDALELFFGMLDSFLLIKTKPHNTFLSKSTQNQIRLSRSLPCVALNMSVNVRPLLGPFDWFSVVL